MIRRKNPTDLSFLKLIKITRTVIDYNRTNKLITYYAWFRNKKIGYVEILSNSNSVLDIMIDYEFRRKGLATFLYDYIEKDLRIKLKPSDDQMEDGIEFWKARIKKKNPRDEEFLKKIRIEKIKYDHMIKYNIYFNTLIGWAEYDKLGKYIVNIFIRNIKDRRKGLATYVYDYIEKDQNIKLKPSPDLLDDGKEFWKARLKK